MFRMLLCLVILLASTGCTRAYWNNRANDVADIFTVTSGAGIGAMAHVGPINAGLGAYGDIVGLRRGEAGTMMGGSGQLIIGGFDSNKSSENAPMQRANLRGKGYSTTNVLVPIDENIPAPYWTNIEVSGGALIGMRVGFNPGELLDFLLGFTTLDIYGDDFITETSVCPQEQKTVEVEMPQEKPGAILLEAPKEKAKTEKNP